MKIWEKLTLLTLNILGYGIMFFLSIRSIWLGLIVGQVEKVKFNLLIGVILLVIGIIFSKWIIKLYNRKLDAIAVADELGVTPETNLIVTRILKLIEILFPLAAFAFIFKGLTDINISTPPNIVLSDILTWVVIGFIILIIHDFFKTLFLKNKKFRETIKLENKIEKFREKESRRRIRQSRG